MNAMNPTPEPATARLEHLIYDDRDFARHADYIHYNPVKHGYAKRVADGPYSRFHREVERGIDLPYWAGGPGYELEVGERVFATSLRCCGGFDSMAENLARQRHALPVHCISKPGTDHVTRGEYR